MKRKLVAAALVVAVSLPIVAKWEGLRLTPYLDLIGVETVCYGETQGVEDRVYTKAECDKMLAGRLEEFYAEIDSCLPDDVPPKAAGMFLSLAYNVGSNAFCKSQTIQSAFARKDYVAACNGINLFNRAGGKVINGLVKRRAEEAKLCLAGLK